MGINGSVRINRQWLSHGDRFRNWLCVEQAICVRAACAPFFQFQPLLPGCFFCVSVAVPPAPEVLPDHPLLEPPAPDLSPDQALLLVWQEFRVKVDPAIRPATQKPAKIFLRPSTSMIPPFGVGDELLPPGAGF
jgi:hypothetical protein